MMAMICTLAWTFTVSIPLLVTDSLGESESDFTLLFSVLSVGSMVGALISARRTTVTTRLLVTTSIAFGVALAALAGAPNLIVAYPAAILIGYASVAFMTAATTALQVAADPAFRGRVTAIHSMVFIGSTPIGSTIVGVAADLTNPRVGVAIGAVSCFVAADYGRRFGRPRARERTPEPDASPPLAVNPTSDP
jgi:MFS family permease